MVIGHLLVAQVHVLMIVEQDTIAQEVVDQVVVQVNGQALQLYHLMQDVLYVL